MPTLLRTTLAVALLAGAVAAPAASALPALPGAADRPAADSYDARHLLVTFAPGTPAAARQAAHAERGARVVNRFEELGTDVVELPEGRNAADVAPRYARNPNVVDTDLNWRFTTRADDTLYKDQWGLRNTGQAVTGSLVKGVADADVDAPEGWAAAFGDGSYPATGGARVGILDTGIDLAHVDLLDKTRACASATSGTGIVVTGTCSDDNLHGTHVAGTVGARTGNGVGVAGVAPNAEFAVFKGLNAAGSGFYADIVAGVRWLHTSGGAKVISMSIGGPQDGALDKALSDAWAAGALLVAAAGNDGDTTANWPAHHRDVVSVAATDAAGRVAGFSTCNADVEVAAPGKDIWSTFPGNGYGSISGTSMATPHVSGVASLVWWREPGLTNADVRRRLTDTAQGSVDCRGAATVGVVNLAAALGTSGGGGTAPAPVGTGSIAGTVSTGSGKDRQPLGGATVDCGDGHAATTDAAGAYTIASVPTGSRTCTASASGYRPKSATVTVEADTTTRLDLVLR